MSRGHCVGTVTGLLRALPGVEEVEVEVGRATLVGPSCPGREAIVEALDEAGFDLESLEEQPS